LVRGQNFILVGLGFELKAIHLPGRPSTPWATPLALFALAVLMIRSHFLPKLDWTVILLFKASLHCWDDRHTWLDPPFFCWDVVLHKLSLSHDPPKLTLSSS
jgi:hypothetical protein